MIYLGPVAPAHYATIVQWLNDPDALRFSRHHGQRHTVETQRDFISRIQPPSRYWGLFDARRLVGTMTWMVKDRRLDVGLLIGFPQCGSATEALRQTIVLAAVAGYDRVTAGCHCEHTAMQRVCEKAGMMRTREEGGNYYYASVL